MNSKLAITICAIIWLLALWLAQATVPIYEDLYGPGILFVQDAKWHAVPAAMLGLLTLAVVYFRGGRYPRRSAVTAVAFWLLGFLYLVKQCLPLLTTIRAV